MTMTNAQPNPTTTDAGGQRRQRLHPSSGLSAGRDVFGTAPASVQSAAQLA
jgi:hypothetical protein